MSATVARPPTSEGAHFYTVDGLPLYETAKSGGGTRPFTLADARKLNPRPYPSVTTILSCRHKPALQSWLVEQAVLAAMTTPQLPDESLDAFIERVLHAERHQDQESDKAKARGTQIHDAMEKLFKGEPIDEEIKPWVMPAFEEVSKFGLPVATEHCFAKNGYGGRCDLIQEVLDLALSDSEIERLGTKTISSMKMVWDWKTAKRIPQKPYDEARLQVAAYCMALDAERGGNVYISTTNCGEFRIFEHQNIPETYYKGFEPLLAHWMWSNSYFVEMKYSDKETIQFVKRLDAALVARKSKEAKVDEYANEKCEVCGDNIHRYIGPKPGIICSTCLEQTGEGECVRVEPLVITRSSIRE